MHERPDHPRRRRLVPASLGLLLALVSCEGAGESPSPAAEPPPTPPAPNADLLLVSLDTTRFDHLGLAGAATTATPHLDRQSRHSTLWADHRSPAPSTLAAHTSLFTGTYAHTHGTPRNGFVVHADNRTLAEALQARGMHTAAFVGSFALDHRFGLDQGFDHYDDRYSTLARDGIAEQNERPAADVTEAALSHLRAQPSSTPLFLFAHYFDPHQPYQAPLPWAHLPGPRPAPFALDEVASPCADRADPRVGWLEAAYVAEIAATDFEVGRLLRTFGSLRPHSLVAVVTDHGENLTDHPRCFSHGETVYDSTIRALAMLRIPGSSGRLSAIPTSHVDVAPTILAELGLPASPLAEGTPSAEIPEDRPRYAEATKRLPDEAPPAPGRWANVDRRKCVLQGSYKLLLDPSSGSVELYDLASDPAENRDIGSDHPELQARLTRLLGDWSPRSPVGSSDAEDSSESRRRLESLGYIP